MEKKKILFISQEITPYLPETEMSYIGRHLPQGIQESGKEVRVFMPRFGTINERRNQLHEVIRLSGMNLIIDDTDHSLIIKVASIQQARMQVYFIDNDEYFKRKFTTTDADGNFFEDNDERLIFFGRGVLETVKKLRWIPDVIHCHGWMTSLVPLFIKTAYKNDPVFANSKVVYSLYNDDFTENFNPAIKEKVIIPGIEPEHVAKLDNPNFKGITELAVDFADAFVIGNPQINPDIKAYVEKSGKDILPYQEKDAYIKKYAEFYDKILSE